MIPTIIWRPIRSRIGQIQGRMQDETGATLVLVALMLVALLGFVGLALDGSNAYAQQQRMQVAADAAALAGGRRLALNEGTTLAEQDAETLGTMNGADSLTITFLENNTQIQVVAQRTFDTTFARIVGTEQFTVTASARAGSVVVGRMGNLMPLTTMCIEGGFVFGQEYNLYEGELVAPGNFSWLRWSESDSPSAEMLENNIWNPSLSRTLEIGDIMWGTTGAKPTSSVKGGLDFWLNKPVTIPLYDQVTGTGSNAQYRVCGFAQFVMTAHQLSGNPVYLTGRFIRNLTPGEAAAAGAADLGTRDVHMLQ